MFHIAFEGIDNAGKTTLTDYLQDLLLGKKVKAVVTKELTSDVGKIILEHFKAKIKLSPELKTYLFAADRLIRFEEISFQKYDVVIWDRYVYSALVYREMENIDVSWVEKVNSIFPVADLTYYIDIDPLEALKRGKLANKVCPYNKKELSLCRDIYKRYVNSGEMIEIVSQNLNLMTGKILEDMVKLYE